MAVRPYWRGYLKLSLVTCQVTLSPATSDSSRLRFHTINRATGDRIFTRYVDAVSGKEVEAEQQVHAYEKGEDDYLPLEEDELDSIELESVRTIDIEKFVEADSIGWVYYDTPYFVVPSDEVGQEAYVVVRDAMAKAGVVGISRLVLGNREHAVMLEPFGNGIVLWTLRYGDEVRDEDEYFKAVGAAKPEADLAKVLAKLIESRTTTWSDEMVKDPVQAKLRQIIAAKDKPARKAKPATASDEPAAATNVIDLMAALKKSLAGKAESSTAKHR